MCMKKELLKTIHLKHHTSFFLIFGHCNVEQEFNSDFKKIPKRNVARYLYKSPIPITTEEVAYHGKQTILWVSYKSPISGRLFKIHSPQQDSPVSEKTFSLLFGGPS